MTAQAMFNHVWILTGARTQPSKGTRLFRTAKRDGTTRQVHGLHQQHSRGWFKINEGGLINLVWYCDHLRMPGMMIPL